MNRTISEMVEQWEKDIESGYAQLIKSELSRFDIDEEQGLNRVKVEYNSDAVKAILYSNEYPDAVPVSNWYIDGKLAFSIYRKFKMKNKGPDEVIVTEIYFAVRDTLIKNPFEHFILDRFERKV